MRHSGSTYHRAGPSHTNSSTLYGNRSTRCCKYASSSTTFTLPLARKHLQHRVRTKRAMPTSCLWIRDPSLLATVHLASGNLMCHWLVLVLSIKVVSQALIRPQFTSCPATSVRFVCWSALVVVGLLFAYEWPFLLPTLRSISALVGSL
jgi:hypothetical protein